MSGSASKRQLIINAAQAVFSDVGFDRARVSDIARKAGVADGTIYLYFKSKDELLISLFEERVLPMMKAIEGAVAEGPQDPRGRLASLVQAYIDAMEENPSLGSIITMQVRQSRRFVTDYDNRPLARFFGGIGEIVQAGQAQGMFRRDLHIDTLRWMIFGALDAFTLSWGLGHSSDADLSRMGDELVQLLLRGLGSGEFQTMMPSPAEAPAAALPPETFDPALD